jgi:Ran-binding protein 3
MVRSSERPDQPPTKVAGSAVEPQGTSAKSDLPPSPTHSDKSSDSEGRPVREKLKDTRIDALSSSDAVPGADLPMSDAPNGNGAVTARSREQSPSGSESERGRLRRKRSREEFEEEQEAEKHAEKKERHARKKSRDVTSPQDSDADPLTKPTKTSIPPIIENDVDESMLSGDEPGKVQNATSTSAPSAETGTSDNQTGTTVSPKNKRTRDQADKTESTVAAGISKDGVAEGKTEEERTTKRPRDKDDPQPPAEAESKIKVRFLVSRSSVSC